MNESILQQGANNSLEEGGGLYTENRDYSGAVRATPIRHGVFEGAEIIKESSKRLSDETGEEGLVERVVSEEGPVIKERDDFLAPSTGSERTILDVSPKKKDELMTKGLAIDSRERTEKTVEEMLSEIRRGDLGVLKSGDLARSGLTSSLGEGPKSVDDSLDSQSVLVAEYSEGALMSGEVAKEVKTGEAGGNSSEPAESAESSTSDGSVIDFEGTKKEADQISTELESDIERTQVKFESLLDRVKAERAKILADAEEVQRGASEKIVQAKKGHDKEIGEIEAENTALAQERKTEDERLAQERKMKDEKLKARREEAERKYQLVVDEANKILTVTSEIIKSHQPSSEASGGEVIELRPQGSDAYSEPEELPRAA